MKLRILTCLIATLVAVHLAPAQDLPVVEGLQLWLDATDESTVSRDGFDLVESWMDKSPNQFEAYADTAGFPTYQMDGINGQPSVRFFGDFNDGMVIDGLELQRPYTAFIVNQYHDDCEPCARGRTLQSQDINWLLGLWAGNYGHYADGWVNSRQPAAEVNRPYVADAIGTETESFFTINGTDWTQNSSHLGIPGSLGIAGEGAFAGEVSDADVSEIVIYDRVLSAEELNSMRTHLYTKYGAEPVDGPPPPPMLDVRQGAIAQFMSASDLDFSGDFVYAINAGGPAENPDTFESLVIDDAEFLDGTNAAQPDLDEIGARINVANEAGMWYGDPNYGDTIEDDNLEFMMRSIRWNVPPGVTIDLDVEAGESYKLQMLFAEEAWDRGFDIFMEGEEVVSDFVIHLAQDGMANREVGVSYTREFVADDDELNIALGGVVGVPDNNPLFQVLTLEKIEAIMVPDADCNGDGVVDINDANCTPDDQLDDFLASIGTLRGDADGDGQVQFSDFAILADNFGNPGQYTDGDFDKDNQVQFGDFTVLADNFGKTPEATTAAVPEPCTQATLGLAGLLLAIVVRRRGRSI